MPSSSRMNRVIEILDHVQSDIEQILLLLKMDEEDEPSTAQTFWGGCTRTDLDDDANEKLKQFIQGFAYKKQNSEN